MQDEKNSTQEVVIKTEKAFLETFEDYLTQCGEDKRFPNLAGLCRFCGIGEERFSSLRSRFPDAGNFVLMALEDCALNADRPPTVVTAYLKHRLGYGEAQAGGEPTVILTDRAMMDDGE